MVGNRLEADVAPARRLGMRTVFCYLSPEEKGWHPTEPDRRYYLDELARVPNWRREPLAPEEAPDATVRSMAEVDPLIAAWQRES